MSPSREIRTLRGLQVRAAAVESGAIGTLIGHAAVFNSDSVEFAGWGKPWIERIAPGAFHRTLRERPDVFALWSHRTDSPIARAPDTLRLREDPEGLLVEIDLIETQRNADLLKEVRAGLIDAMSFGFEVVAEKWEKGQTHDTRTLLDVDLYEVSPVLFPAYPATSLAARSLVARAAEAGPDLEREMRAVAARRDAALAAAPAAHRPLYSFAHWRAGIMPAAPGA